jgi:hypothetical protein
VDGVKKTIGAVAIAILQAVAVLSPARDGAAEVQEPRDWQDQSAVALRRHAFAAFFLRFASVLKRSALSLMKPEASW